MSHTKGLQDCAGTNLKHKADMAVIKGQEVIQKAEDLYNFARNNLKTPSPSLYQSENMQLKGEVFSLWRKSIEIVEDGTSKKSEETV